MNDFKGITIFSTLGMDKQIDFNILKNLWYYDYEKLNNKTGEISIDGVVIFKTPKTDKIIIVDMKNHNFYSSYNTYYIDKINKLFMIYGYPPYGEEFRFFLDDGELWGTISGSKFKL